MEPVVWTTLGTTCEDVINGLEFLVDPPMWSLVDQQDERKKVFHSVLTWCLIQWSCEYWYFKQKDIRCDLITYYSCENYSLLLSTIPNSLPVKINKYNTIIVQVYAWPRNPSSMWCKSKAAKNGFHIFLIKNIARLAVSFNPGVVQKGWFRQGLLRQHINSLPGRSVLLTWKYQFSYDHWSQAMLGSVSTWMGDSHSSVVWVLLLTLKVG